MTPGARASAAIEILDRVLAGASVEQVLTNWSRGARYAGSTDRAEIRDIVFQCLRCRSSFAAKGGGLTGRGLFLGYARSGIIGDTGADAASHAAVWFGGGPYDPPPPDPLGETGRDPEGAECHDIPAWLEAPLHHSLGADFAAVMRAMKDRAPVYLRVNPAKADKAQAVRLLAEDGITTENIPNLPLALMVTAGERRIKTGKAYGLGAVELQDLSSQAIVAALPLRDGMRVLDHCAGGGGKALAMAAEAPITLYAHDIEPRRMADLPDRAARAGVKVSLTQNPEAEAPYDLVLVDAPCSGSGSWRRDPEGKWGLQPGRLAELVRIQAGILDRAAQMVAKGGWLAYATCSFLREENQTQAAGFLARHPDWEQQESLSLTPLTRSDGFYLGTFRRVAAK